MYKRTLYSLGAASTALTVYKFYQRFLHFAFIETRRLAVAQKVIGSSACVDSYPTGEATDSVSTSFVDCEAAREALSSAMPTMNALAAALDEWFFWGEGRWQRALLYVEEMLRPMIYVLPLFAVLLLWALGNCLYHDMAYRYDARRGRSELDVGRPVGNLCVGASGYRSPFVQVHDIDSRRSTRRPSSTGLSMRRSIGGPRFESDLEL